MTFHLNFSCESLTPKGDMSIVWHAVWPKQYVIAGWTGRDAQAIEHDIHELQASGVPAASTVPLYYRASATMLTQSHSIQVLGADSSGEAEPMLFFAEGEWWLTVSSDHTDRRVETYSVAVSKQMCPKPTAISAWRWADVQAYQDEIELSSRILEDGVWIDYQRGSFAAIRPLETLQAGAFAQGTVQDGCFVSCGTLGAIKNAQGEGIRAATEMEIQLYDPRRQRSIIHRYAVEVLPVIS
jgi:hypothetical protein